MHEAAGQTTAGKLASSFVAQKTRGRFAMFSKITVSQKLTWGFVAIGLLLMGMGSTALYNIGQVNHAATNVVSNWMPRVARLLQLQNEIESFRIDELQHILSNNDSQREDYEKGFSAKLARIKAIQAFYDPLEKSAQEERLYRSFLESWASYLGEHQKILLLSRLDRDAEATALTRDVQLLQFERAKAVLQEAVQLNVGSSEASGSLVLRIYRSTWDSVLLFVTVSVVLGLSIAFLIIRSIRRQIGGEIEYAYAITQAISRGDLRTQVSLKAHDTGSLLAAIIVMKDRIADMLDAIARNSMLIHEKEAFLSKLIDCLPVAVYCKDSRQDFRFTLWSKHSVELFGRTKESVIGHKGSDWLTPDQIREVEAADDLVLRTGRPLHLLQELTSPGGGKLIVQTTKTSLPDAEGHARFVLVVSEDITESQQRQKELQEAREAADAGSQAKSAFLATMSHEIRTPMNGVVGMLDILRETPLREDQRDMVGTAQASAFALLRIIDDILDFSKIEAGKMLFESIEFSILSVMENVSETMLQNAIKKDVRLTVFCDPDIPEMVAGDSGRLQQILFNLVGNAVKFAGNDRNRTGQVFLRADKLATSGTEDEIRVVFQVIDNGIGMDQSMIEQLFKPFSQAESSTTRRFGGTGLGLSICARLVALQRGSIAVRSQLGQGATFTVDLPFKTAKKSSPPPAPATAGLDGLNIMLRIDSPALLESATRYLRAFGAHVRQQVEDTFIDLVIADAHAPSEDQAFADALRAQPAFTKSRFIFLTAGLRRHARIDDKGAVSLDAYPMRKESLQQAIDLALGRISPKGPAGVEPLPIDPVPALSVDEAQAQGRLILVADDNETNRKVLRQQLAMLGYTAETAEHGLQALEMLQSKSYALLLTDCHMPEMDGFTLTTAVRTHRLQTPSDIPIIAVTANAMQGEAQRCISAGMNDYLAKPAPLKALKAMVEKWLPTAPPAAHATTGLPSTRDARAESPIDPAALTALVGDDPALHLEFLEDFVRTARPMIIDLDEAYLRRDCLAIGAGGHKLKSSSKAVGAMELARACEALEAAGRTQDWPSIDMQVPRLNGLFAAIEAYAEQQRSQPPGNPQ